MKALTLAFFAILVSISGFAQEITCDVMSTYSPLTVTQDDLRDAKNLNDLNEIYPGDWVADYVAVDVESTVNGEIKKASGVSDKLNEKQISILKNADIGSDIKVSVSYYPDNNLSGQTLRSIDFSCYIKPNNAEFPGGEEALMKYLEAAAINDVNEKALTNANLASIAFVIDENGKATQVKSVEFSGDDSLDSRLVELIDNMPTWKPAYDSEGNNYEQAFEFVIGHNFGCYAPCYQTQASR
jgi:hypothetical protein